MEETFKSIWMIIFILGIICTLIASTIGFIVDQVDSYKTRLYRKNGYEMGNIRVEPDRYVYGIKKYDKDTDIMRYIPIGEFYSIKTSKLKKMIEEDEVHEIFNYEKGEANAGGI